MKNRTEGPAVMERSGLLDRLSRLTEIVYVHIDMDVLDPSEVRGHPLTAPEGLSLHAACRLIEGAIKGVKKR